MTKYLINRLLQAVPTVVLVTILVFMMLHFTPGDPAQVFLGDKLSTPEMLERVREDMGLNRPLHVQYLSYMGNALRGDLGRSLITNIPVGDSIMQRLPHTLELTIASMLIATILGVGLGLLAALRHNTRVDTGAMIIALIGISMPVYWSSLLAILVFSVALQWLPPIGQGSFDRLIMPALALALVSMGGMARMMRSSMLEVLSEDYVMTARAKGLSKQIVVLRHAMRNALIPVITILGLSFGSLLGGAVLTETIFARLGIGAMYVKAVLQKDFTLVQGTTLFVSLAYVLVNIVIDTIYVYVDPRIRYD